MKQARVSIPATSANLGPGFDALGLALSLRNQVVIEEQDAPTSLEIQGEGDMRLPRNESNIVIKSIETVYRKVGEQVPNLKVTLINAIPPGSGFGSSAAAIIGGMVGANILLDSPLSREELLRMAVEMEGHPDNACAAMLGGLVISSFSDEGLVYRRVPVAPLKVAAVRPDQVSLTEELRAMLPKTVPLADAAVNIGRAALVVQALAEGDLDLLGEVMKDRLHEPYRKVSIPGYMQAVNAALSAGAAAIAISGSGPSLIAFASSNHEQISAAMKDAFDKATSRPARAWVLSVESQGVQIGA